MKRFGIYRNGTQICFLFANSEVEAWDEIMAFYGKTNGYEVHEEEDINN